MSDREPVSAGAEERPICATCGEPDNSGPPNWSRKHELGEFGRGYSHPFVPVVPTTNPTPSPARESEEGQPQVESSAIAATTVERFNANAFEPINNPADRDLLRRLIDSGLASARASAEKERDALTDALVRYSDDAREEQIRNLQRAVHQGEIEQAKLRNQVAEITQQRDEALADAKLHEDLSRRACADALESSALAQKAQEAERERCVKAICGPCREGWEAFRQGEAWWHKGGLLIPQPRFCDASAIRDAITKLRESGEGEVSERNTPGGHWEKLAMTAHQPSSDKPFEVMLEKARTLHRSGPCWGDDACPTCVGVALALTESEEARASAEKERDAYALKLGGWAEARAMGELLGSRKIPGGISYVELEADTADAHKRIAELEASVAEITRQRNSEWSNALWPTNPEGETEPMTPEQGAAWKAVQDARTVEDFSALAQKAQEADRWTIMLGVWLRDQLRVEREAIKGKPFNARADGVIDALQAVLAYVNTDAALRSLPSAPATPMERLKEAHAREAEFMEAPATPETPSEEKEPKK